MNELPTICEVVTGTAKKQVEERTAATNNTSRKSKSAWKSRTSDFPPKMARLLQLKDEEEGQDEEEGEEDGETYCGSCGGVYTTESSDFWIGCDVCNGWFHGKCVKITPTRALRIKHYKCRSCSNQRARI